MDKRGSQMQALAGETFDVLIVGAGIQGAACAARLAAQGVKVALIDSGDFGSGTSQGSSHLIWGGIKYLENGEFKLVQELCRSRNELIKRFPLSISPIRFLLCPQDGKRSMGKLFIGAWLYYLLGFFRGSVPKYFSRKRLQKQFSFLHTDNMLGAVEYSDAHLTDSDARFVFHFVRKAQKNGCIALNYAELTQAEFNGAIWEAKVNDTVTNRSIHIRAKSLINATGPRAEDFSKLIHLPTQYKVMWSKGVHLVIKKLHPLDEVLATFADDGRLFYAIPFGYDQTLVGTTDTEIDSLPGKITDDDRDFILRNMNALVKRDKPITRSDVISELYGVRPLVTDSTNDGFCASRKHIVERDAGKRAVSIFGGKLTDCLNVAREVSEAIRSFGIQLKSLKPDWCGDSKAVDYKKLVTFSSANGVDFKKLLARYGEDATHIAEMIQKDPKLNSEIIEGGKITRAEVLYMSENESVVTLEDFLRRRTMLAMQFTKKELLESEGLREAASMLFGENAEAKYKQFSDS